MLFEPVDGLSVKMVGRLVKKKYIGLLEKKSAKSHTTALATGKHSDFLIIRRTTQSVHRPIKLIVDIPRVRSIKLVLKFGLTLDQLVHFFRILKHFRICKSIVDLIIFPKKRENRLDTFLNDLTHSFIGIEFRFLLKISDGIIVIENHISLIALVKTGYYFKES